MNKGEFDNDRFYKRPLCPAGHGRTGPASGRRLHKLQFLCFAFLIAERQDISEKYLESILKVLVQDKLLTGLRGRGGGYRLTKAPEDYTLGEILRLTEGSLAPVACTDDGEHDCPRKRICPSHPVWQKLDNMINEFFDGITLADLIQTPPQ